MATERAEWDLAAITTKWQRRWWDAKVHHAERPADEDGAHAVAGHGQTTVKNGRNGNGATHYNFELGGTASILTQTE